MVNIVMDLSKVECRAIQALAKEREVSNSINTRLGDYYHGDGKCNDNEWQMLSIQANSNSIRMAVLEGIVKSCVNYKGYSNQVSLSEEEFAAIKLYL